MQERLLKLPKKKLKNGDELSHISEIYDEFSQYGMDYSGRRKREFHARKNSESIRGSDEFSSSGGNFKGLKQKDF